MHTFLVITAGGQGQRMGASFPKQFIKIGDKEILRLTIEKFLRLQKLHFDGIVITAPESYVKETEDIVSKILRENSAREVQRTLIDIIAGGATRTESVALALKAIKKKYASNRHETHKEPISLKRIAEEDLNVELNNSNELRSDDVILIHDAVRPYVSGNLVEIVARTARSSGSAIPVLPVKDTIRDLQGRTLERDFLRKVQTPQGFNAKRIINAYNSIDAGEEFTDDASVYERIYQDLSFVKGEEENIKITTMKDLKEDFRIGNGFDVHRLEEGRDLVLCGVNIEHSKGLLGHSDADVATHALMDSMLGALSLGDIGKYFPDTDEKYKGVRSISLLKCVNKIIQEKGYRISNADITIVCEKPKISPYVTEMREKISSALETDFQNVGIKATTTECLGFTGREEGIASFCTVMLVRDFKELK